MEKERVIILNFDIESVSYQAFSEIKAMHAKGQLNVEQMAIVKHSDDGEHQFEIKDFIDFTGRNHTNKDGLIGMMVGILGGPLGVMLGWFTGSMVGSARDVKEIKQATTIFDHLVEKIGEGATGVILSVTEEDNRLLNDLVFYQLKGNITRLELSTVVEEVKEAQALSEKKALE